MVVMVEKVERERRIVGERRMPSSLVWMTG